MSVNPKNLRSADLPPEAMDLLEKPALGMLATIGEDGHPQVTPVWANVEAGLLAFNTAAGRVKHRNMERDPRVTLTVVDPDDPYRWVSILGRVTMTTDGADEHIDRLAKKYLGKDRYPWRSADETRVTVYVEPERIVTS